MNLKFITEESLPTMLSWKVESAFARDIHAEVRRPGGCILRDNKSKCNLTVGSVSIILCPEFSLV